MVVEGVQVYDFRLCVRVVLVFRCFRSSGGLVLQFVEVVFF